MAAEVTSERRDVSLGECAVINDSTYSLKEGWETVYYLDTGNISENRVSEIQHLERGKHKIPSRARRKVKPGDIVYSTVRPNQKHFGILKNIPANFLASTGFAVLRGKPGIADTRFLYWFLAQDQVVDYLHSIAENSTSAYPSIKPSDLGQLTLSLPPLPEQRSIAGVLGALDDKIELNRRMNETLEQMARALFKSWFVDFDPVRAKMEGRWRPGQSLPGLPAHLYDLFPSRLVTSEVGEIPSGWELTPLGEVIAIHDSRRIPLNARQRAIRRGPYPYYGAAGIMDWVDDFLFEGVHVLTGEDGSVVDADGHPVIQYVWGQFWVNNHAHVLSGTNGISDEHLYLLLREINITAFVTGAVQPKLSQKNLKAIPFFLPTGLVCSAFSDLIAPLFDELRNNAIETKQLAILRDTLLPKMMSGESQISVVMH